MRLQPKIRLHLGFRPRLLVAVWARSEHPLVWQSSRQLRAVERGKGGALLSFHLRPTLARGRPGQQVDGGDAALCVLRPRRERLGRSGAVISN